ncbi:ABC transporter ATP-binding protein [Actinospica durhamensis]|uniref:ABC transporter ATP-binding protein n=1 Tax=Actinospica durhamensis TaxID=1508375 RepID=A0A941EZS3_9ACTN|nr:ABC transporter ATP-binding protein [Actinospica durhamensis]MBR7837349.1 ABC transporter ATP-binding protein [Actinospica durhamensis]
MIEARGLFKRYPSRGGEPFTAVAGIDLDVRPGECFGLLGPNGAGKSTTMRMIGCVSRPTAGSLSILGLDAAVHGAAIRARIGVVPQDDALDSELTVAENFLVYGRYFGLGKRVIRERTTRLLEFAQLADKADQRVDTLSGGMRRRLAIARAMINEPVLVLLDEPTTGLDPQARHVLWERLFRLKREGVTLVLTTHYMDEAEQLCDRLVVIDGGQVVDAGTPRELIERHCTREVLELRYDSGDLADLAARVRGGLAQPTETGAAPSPGVQQALAVRERVEILPDRLLYYTDDGEAALADIHHRALSPATALVRRATLEDVFLALTGRTLVD